MADGATTTYSFTLPEVGASEDSWGTKLNANWSLADDLLDGTTAISPNLSTLKIAGVAVTSTAAELNILDGVTATAAELNYNDITTLGSVQASKTVTADANGDVLWPDNEKAFFGTGSDLQIYHDASNSYIDDAGSGSLYLRSNNIRLNKYTGEQMINCSADGAVSLFYDNATKLATTSYGIDISGSAVADTDTSGSHTGAQTPDFNTYQNFVWTLTGNVTLSNPTTEKVGQSGFFIFIQDGTGGRTVSLGTDFETAGGAGITLSTAASAVDVVPYVVKASGSIQLGTPQLAFA